MQEAVTFATSRGRPDILAPALQILRKSVCGPKSQKCCMQKKYSDF